MFKKIKQALSINDVSFTRRNDEERRPRGIGQNIVHISNPSINDRIPQHHAEPYRAAHVVAPNALSTSSASCSDSALVSTYSEPIAHSSSSLASYTHTGSIGNLVFTNLMESTDLQDLQKNSFFQMNVMDLINAARTLSNQPSASEFKMVLFNDSFGVCRINLKQNVIHEIRNALLQGTAMSYLFLGNMAISLSQCMAAAATLRQEGIIPMSEFNNMSLRLHRYVDELSRIGNTYYSYVNSGANPDAGLYHLVARPAQNKDGRKLYGDCESLDKHMKSMITPEHKRAMSQNLNMIVNQFIYHYFQLAQQPQQGQSIQLKNYISPNELGQIQALFKNTSRDGEGHQVNAGGAQHVYECYAEMFNHFIPKHQINLQ